MKALYTTLATIAISAFALTAQAFEVASPQLNVGTTWTYKEVDGYTGVERSRFAHKVVGKSDKGYTISRVVGSMEVTRYDITMNWGQATPVEGKIGNGDYLKFPLTAGKSWESVSYVKRPTGVIKDTINYTVVGKESVTVEAGTFEAIKLKGSGTWENLTMNARGDIEVEVYYVPTMEVVALSKRTNRIPGYGPQKNNFELATIERVTESK